MRPETKVCLDDLVRAGRLVQEAPTGVSLDQFLAHWEKQAAVERQFMIVGEALVRVRGFEPAVFDKIPDTPAVVGFRNILAHGDYDADPEAIYDFAGQPLTDLIASVEAILPA